MFGKIKKKRKAGQSGKKGEKRGRVGNPGFLNFKLVENSAAGFLIDMAKADAAYGKSEFGKGKRVLIEFVSANPTGPLTIAHGRQAALGDTLARILNAVGFKADKEFYLNDAGRQIRLLGESIWARFCELSGKPYAFPEEGYKGTYLIDIARELKEQFGESLLSKKSAEAIDTARQFGVTKILDSIKKDLADMRIVFDNYFSEKSLYERKVVEEVIERLRAKQLVFEAEGAVWFRSTDFGDDKDRVLRKSTGENTYLAPDIAYHSVKFGRGYERLVNLWGPDHHGYVPRLKAACQALGYSKDQIDVLIVQLTTLYRDGVPVRMSTRAGEFVTLRELMDEVGVDATRFFFLMRKVDSHLDFDLELAKKQSDENPVYYLQYAHARISSILAYANRPDEQVDDLMKADLSRIIEPEEINLIKKMSEFPEALVQAATNLEPYRIVDYLRELAASFHKFYALHRVVSDDPSLTQARLLLTHCVRLVLRNGLTVLGVSAPKKM